MSLRRIGILFLKEIRYAPKNFIFMFALGVPIILSLILSLAFGTLFAGKPKFGISDQGNSQLTHFALQRDSLVVREYETTAELIAATERGTVDLGVVLPEDFDQLVIAGETAEIEAYIWGESLLKERAILGATIAALVREIAGQEAPVEIISSIVGEDQTVSWESRLLPFVLMISILLAGTFVPATSIVEEKMKRTLGALVVSPSTLGEILTAKAILGAVISVLMALVVLFINNALGATPGILLLILSAGAISASIFGVLLGVMMKDINSLFATLKAIGLALYAPALLYIFPSIPAWVSRIFPTYYIINPLVEITQKGAVLRDVVIDLTILGLIAIVMILLIGLSIRRVRLSEA